MAVIFWLSSRTADESSQQSGFLLQWLIDKFGDNFFTDFIVRKMAHFLEFTGLCLLFNIALWQTKQKKMPVLSIIYTSFYAASDEIHQLFVNGRSCQFTDWVLDTSGAVMGTIGFLILFTIVIKISKRKNAIDTGNN